MDEKKRREEKKSANERIIMSPLSNICKPVTARGNGAKVMSFDLLWPYHSLILSYQPMGAMGGPSVQYQATLKFASVE